MDRCPVCQSALPPEYAGASCPSCGVRLPSATKSRISLTPLGTPKPRPPSDRPPVPAEDRWDISDDPAPSPYPPATDVPLGAPVAPSNRPAPPTTPVSASTRPADPLRATLGIGELSIPSAPATPKNVDDPDSGSVRPPPSAPGPSGAQRGDGQPTPTLALESKDLRAMLVAKAQAAGVIPSAATNAKPARVGSTTIGHDEPVANKAQAPSSAGTSSRPPGSEPSTRSTMVFSASEMASAAAAKSAATAPTSAPSSAGTTGKSKPADPLTSTIGIGVSAFALAESAKLATPAKPAQPAPEPAKPAATPSSAGRIGAQPAAPDASGPNIRGTLIMSAPLVAQSAQSPAQSKPAASATPAAEPAKAPASAASTSRDASDELRISSTIVGHAPVAAARPASTPPTKSLSQTLVGTSPLAASTPSTSDASATGAKVREAPPPSTQESRAPAPSSLPSLTSTLVHGAPVAPSEGRSPDDSQSQTTSSEPPPPARAPTPPVGSATLRDGTPDSAASARTATTPAGFAATLEHNAVTGDLGAVAPKREPPTPSSQPVSVQPTPKTPTKPPVATASTPPSTASAQHKAVSTPSARPVIAALTPGSPDDASSRRRAQSQAEDAPEVGESALRIALATAGTVVIASSVPALLKDALAAATWTIPGVIALVLAFVPIGHATRALLAFAPALPALAVRAMGCEGHSVSGALALTALLALLPAALLFRSHYTRSRRARLLVAGGLVVGVVWALLPGGGATLASGGGPWAATHLPALSFFAVALFSLSAFVPGRSSMGTAVWAILAIVWATIPALGSRAEQFAPRALDALSLAGLGAIASTTLAALLSVYAAPDDPKG
ncbi:MAG: hypothetical protein JNK05_11140 [Myxococcales bacterium]|nr:hypothetical protein [Myxococcales bacterium]